MVGKDLKNKRIVVFGGAGQIGFSLVKFLAQNQVEVVVVDIDKEYFELKLLEHNLSYIDFITCDVSNETEIENVFIQLNKLSGYDGIVNCIHFKGNNRKLDSSSNFFSNYLDYPVEAWDEVHDVNLRGTFLINRCAIKHKHKNSLSIINVSSTYGLGSPNPSIYGNSGINSPIAYASSKSAIINLSKYFAVHSSASNVRVNVLTPGGVYNNQDKEFISRYENLTVLKRMAKPEDYIGGFVFLLSDMSSYMTGSNLVIDGGWTAW